MLYGIQQWIQYVAGVLGVDRHVPHVAVWTAWASVRWVATNKPSFTAHADCS